MYTLQRTHTRGSESSLGNIWRLRTAIIFIAILLFHLKFTEYHRLSSLNCNEDAPNVLERRVNLTVPSDETRRRSLARIHTAKATTSHTDQDVDYVLQIRVHMAQYNYTLLIGREKQMARACEYSFFSFL